MSSPRIRQTAIENPVSPAGALAHLVSEHGWDEHTPVDSLMVMAHKLAHGRHGHLDLADADLRHVHPGVVGGFLGRLWHPVEPFEVVKTWEEDEDGNIIDTAEPVVPVARANRASMSTQLSDLSTAEKLAAAAGVALAVGAFLPWITVTAPFFGTISRSGMSDSFSDGWIAIVLGIAIALTALNRKPDLTLLAGIGSAIFVGVEYSNVSNRISDAQGVSSLVTTSVGTGIWLMAVAAAVGIIASLHARRDAEAESFAAQFLDTDADTESL